MADPLSSSLGISFHQILDQKRNVILPLAQGWYTYRENVKPIEEILAECTGSNGSFQVTVCCREHSHVDGNRVAAPDPLEFAFLEHSQQSNLRLGRKFADLVQKNGSTIGRFEATCASLYRSGEGALLVA